MNKTLPILSLVALAAASMAQSRTFVWGGPDSSQSFTYDGTGPSSGVLNVPTTINVEPYVSISAPTSNSNLNGVFDTTVDVTGLGPGNSSAPPTYFQILTNVDLGFSFNVPQVTDTNNGTGNAVTPFDAVEVALYPRLFDANLGLLSTSAVTVSSNSFAGSASPLSLGLSQTTNGLAYLNIQRTIYVGNVPGNHTYSCAATVTVSVN